MRSYALFLAWLLLTVAMVFLLFSDAWLQIPVCRLCWYQRVCFFPLVVMLTIAVYRQDMGIKLYAIPLAVLGTFFAAYQYSEQFLPAMRGLLPLCGADGACHAIHLQLWGFITFPLLSFLLGVSVIILIAIARR